jgi:hypothetical protein
MNVSRRIGAFVAATVAAVGMVAVAQAVPASAAPKGPEPVNSLLSTVRADTPTWVNVWWKTDRRACNVKVVAWNSSRVNVDYPSGRAYTSFSHGATLDRRETDFTAFRVTATYSQGNWALIAAQVYYNDCGRHARTKVKSVGFLLPVRR